MYFVGYWYPRLAVHDDLRGWDAEPYRGTAEFYDGFADYSAELTLPAGWTVMATGELANPGEVLSARTRGRLEQALESDSVVTIASPEEMAAGGVTAEGTPPEQASAKSVLVRSTLEGPVLTWRFEAEQVRDFTFTASKVQQWDATSARVADRDGDGREDRVAIHAFHRPDLAPVWAEQRAARFTKHAIEFHSRFTGMAYPWSHMTSVEGTDIIGGGMEFPMLTVIGPYTEQGEEALYNVISHELAHMWIPMIVGTNEKRYAWMDEGATSFLENHSRYDQWPGTDAHVDEGAGYLQVARMGLEQPLMRHGDFYEPGPGYGVASYPKPATLLWTLQKYLGDEVFLEAYRGFIADWAWGHPTPWDLFNAFERAAGRDLDWFWQSFWFETWSLDQAVADVQLEGEQWRIVIEDRGWAPAPVSVVIETTAGERLVREAPVDIWLNGATSFIMTFPASIGVVRSVALDEQGVWPDVDRTNNVWPR